MNKYVYQAKFKLSQEIKAWNRETNPDDSAFVKAQSDLEIFSDLGEQVTEGVLHGKNYASVKARLSSHKTGLMTMTVDRELTDDELQQIVTLFKFEINEDGFNDGLETETETIGDLANYTSVIWDDNNRFKLVNRLISNQ